MKELRIYTPEGKLYKPLATQAAFHASPCHNKSYLGPWGSGKTLVGAVEALILGLEYKGNSRGRFMIGRYNWRELERTTWKTFVDIIPPEIIAKQTKNPLYLLLKPTKINPHGFEYYGYNLKTGQNWRSDMFHGGWIDEVNQDGIEEDIYLELQGRMRASSGPGWVLLTGNTGGRNWVYRYFYARQMEGRSAKKYPDHAGFIPTFEENEHLPEHYKQRLRMLLPEDWMRKYYSGGPEMFDVFEGQILDNFDDDTHVVPDYRVPSEWPRYFGLDHGIDHPTAGVWVASDYDGNLLVYREHRRSSAVPRENAEAILMAEQMGEDPEPEWRECDPNMSERQTAGGMMQAIIDQYREAGLYLNRGNNDVMASITRLKSLLAPDEKRTFPHWHPRRGEPGAPSLYILQSCKATKWELQNWRWKDMAPGYSGKPRVLTKNDDLVAALRYVVMRSPQPARAEVREGAYGWLNRLHREPEYSELMHPDEYIGAR